MRRQIVAADVIRTVAGSRSARLRQPTAGRSSVASRRLSFVCCLSSVVYRLSSVVYRLPWPPLPSLHFHPPEPSVGPGGWSSGQRVPPPRRRSAP